MKILNKIIIAIAVLASLLALSPALAYADSRTKNAIQCGVNSAASGQCDTNPSGDLGTTVRTIVNILSALVGVVAVIMIILAGFRYITSGGKQESVTGAKNTILYAVIGLVVVAMAQIIVRFVLHAVIKPAP